MAVIDTLITEYKVNNRDYIAGSNQAADATDKFASAVGMGMRVVTAFSTAVIALGGAFATLGILSSKKAAEFDAMVKALEAVVGGADAAKKALKELTEIAAMPGLGLEEALKGYTALRRANLSDDMAMRTISAAGNANALASGGRAELEQILRGIAQIALKPNLSGEELMQLNEAGIAASKIITDAFGTADGGELKKLGVTSKEALDALVEGMEKLPKAANSAKNSMENIGMAIDMALVGIGTGINNAFMPIIDNLAAAIGTVDENGLFKLFGEKLAEIAETILPDLGTGAETLEDQLVEMAATAANVAEALANLVMNIEDVINVFSMWDPIKWLTGGKVDVRKSLGEAMSGGVGVKSKGEQLKEEYALEKDLRAKQREKEQTDPVAEAVKEVKDVADTQTNLLMRVAIASESLVELSKSTIGGSAYGDAALSAVNFSGGAPSGSFANQMVGLIDSRISQLIRQTYSRR